MRTTVIGSFPRLVDDLPSAIAKAVDLQLHYGIEVISDGEQRTDMIGYFSDLPGLDIVNNRVYIRDQIKAPDDPSKIAKIIDLTVAQNHLKEKGVEEIPVKLSITGPVTLGFTCASQGLKTGVYRNIKDPSIYMDVANALNSIIYEALQREALVQIDEPGISAGYVNPKLAVQVLNETIKGIANTPKNVEKLSLHVCGDLTKIPDLLSYLSKVNVGTISLAFSGKIEEANQRLPLTEMVYQGKFVGVGCVSVGVNDPSQVMTKEEAASIVNLIASKTGLDKIRYIHPDCGLKSLPYSVVERILKVTSKIKKIVK